jgi:DNA-directed RNA polymerase specialized sigma24 family protein
MRRVDLGSAAVNFSYLARPIRELLSVTDCQRRVEIDRGADPSVKRGTDISHVNIDDATIVTEDNDDVVVGLDDALNKLARFDERKGRLIELRFFGGLTYEETAEVLSISTSILDRELRPAKAWLKHEPEV